MTEAEYEEYHDLIEELTIMEKERESNIHLSNQHSSEF